MRLAVPCVAAALFASCALADPSEPAKPDPRLGPEVDRICFASTIDGWKEIDNDDKAVLLETGVNRWYRVELTGVCRARDFRFAEWIGVDSRPGGGCVTRGDAILVRGSGPFTQRCIITQINEWDDKAPAPQAPEPTDS